MSSEAAPATGALSIDQAVAVLSAPPKQETQTPEAPKEAAAPANDDTNSAADPTAAESPGAETQTDGEATEVQSQEADGEQTPVEPPKLWDADAKKWFGEHLSREQQEYILKKEDERNASTARSLQEAAEQRKAAEAATSKYEQLCARLDQVIPQAVSEFQGSWAGWENLDWNKVVEQHGADQAFRIKNKYEADLRQMQQLQETAKQVEQNRFQSFVTAETARLPELAPDLADAKHGQARREELGKFLVKLGVPSDRIPWMSALEAGLAYDAMQWRNGKAKAAELVSAPKASPPKKVTPAKPAGTAPQGTPQQQRMAALSRKGNLSIDEAVELYNMKGSVQQ